MAYSRPLASKRIGTGMDLHVMIQQSPDRFCSSDFGSPVTQLLNRVLMLNLGQWIAWGYKYIGRLGVRSEMSQLVNARGDKAHG
jgi:hypothetical protein